MGFKENVLAYKNPDTEPSMDPKKDLCSLLQSNDLIPDDYTKKAISDLVDKVGLLHIEDDNFDDEIRGLWDDLQTLKAAIGDVDAMVIGLDAVLRKYADMSGIDLPDTTNKWFNVADIDKAVVDVNNQNAIQSSKRLVSMCTSGFSDLEGISECVSAKMMQATESTESLMGLFGGSLSKRYEYGPIQPTELGIDVDGIMRSALGAAALNPSYFSLIQEKSYGEIADLINVDLSCIINRFGDGGFQRDTFNGVFCRIMNILMHSILEIPHSSSLELLPYLKYMRDDLYGKFEMFQPGGAQYTYYVLTRTILCCLCAKVEDEIFHMVSSDTQDKCKASLSWLTREEAWCEKCNPIGTCHGKTTQQLFNEWMTSLMSGNTAYPKTAIGKIEEMLSMIPGATTSLLLTNFATTSTDHEEVSSPSITNQITTESSSLRLQVERFSEQDLTKLVQESVRDMIQENHEIIRSGIIRGNKPEKYRIAVAEQSMFQKLKWLQEPSEAHFKRIVDRDCSGQVITEAMLRDDSIANNAVLYADLISRMKMVDES